MKRNISFRTPEVATEVRFEGSSERAIGRNGELNANDKKELIRKIGNLMEVASTSGVDTEDQSKRRVELAAAHRDMVTAAFNDRQAHAELGATLADELYQAANRDGFMRRFMAYQPLSQGDLPRVYMRMKNVVAQVAGAPIRTEAQLIRDNVYTPPEFYITTRPYIQERDIQQTKSDLLNEKYVEALEATMVAEDRTWYTMATRTVGSANPFTSISGQLTPTDVGTVKNLVAQWNIPAANLLMASDLWTDIVGNSNFAAVIDPVSKHELLLNGTLGQLLGMTITTDAFRHPQHKVLNRGEFFVIGAAENHGQYTDRGGVNAQPIDGSTENIPGRGWYMSELMSMVVSNSRSVAKAQRT